MGMIREEQGDKEKDYREEESQNDDGVFPDVEFHEFLGKKEGAKSESSVGNRGNAENETESDTQSERKNHPELSKNEISGHMFGRHDQQSEIHANGAENVDAGSKGDKILNLDTANAQASKNDQKNGARAQTASHSVFVSKANQINQAKRDDTEAKEREESNGRKPAQQGRTEMNG